MSKGPSAWLEESTEGDAKEAAPAIESDPKAAESTNGRKRAEISGIDVEAVCKGCLMRIHFGRDTDPSTVLDTLKAFDPSIKVRDEFPMKRGNRETKTAKVQCITASLNGTYPRVEILCKIEDKASKVTVWKDRIDAFFSGIACLKGLSDAHKVELASTKAEKGNCVTLLESDEGFQITCTGSDDKWGWESFVEPTSEATTNA